MLHPELTKILKATEILLVSVQILRGGGSLLRHSIADIVTPEDVSNKWAAVTDMSDASVTSNIQVILLTSQDSCAEASI